MRVVIVFESLFGNTRQVAEAIADGVRESRPDAEIDCLRVEDANPERVGVADLLVVGGPTHMRGMTSGFSRKMGLQAEQKESEGDQEKSRPEPEEGAEGPGVRDWFHGLSKTRNGARAAAFDTRADFRLAGGAAHAIARRLRGHGYQLAAEPEGFIIEDTEGPLREGELDRAKAWGAALD
ncbi:flavodoxin family protein [Streptomyces lunaelactis]|uniref:flavodoxin family protein n=1 Tax=Streptomyces lunaelactis TaxID=1535768 RepID=UPI0015846F17|nr:flavodoxin domain-containing protein [Streptomyces lunaelactis]NUK06844.1 flavodoxin family protein [Streptomyces lunaelactis]NUK70066.1 flavodoxin family protein [Streptomyces lunaelactis]NUK77475.1 flavodoxin family protein [Streptomyces lunaelactis]NUL01893.1 flavodoxin family protein [Streptomyces lunaelactis]NUL09908.1 flavodoxin family protein [Streptomyces lunaelactis]